MANGKPSRKPGALQAITGGGAQAFDADSRRAQREQTPVTIEGVTFKRRRKDWTTSRTMRLLMREQESSIALANRLRLRISELEAEQTEHAAKGEEDDVDRLERQIGELVERGDDATEAAELVTYRLLALLLVPPGQDDLGDAAPLQGFGPVEDADAAEPAVAFLQPALDVEDAADLARELTGSREPDPTTTPSSETGSD